MADTVTFNIANGNKTTRHATIMVENKQIINSLVTVGKNNTIKLADFQKLQEVARKNGDAGILEQCDLGAKEKQKLAMMNGFSEYYDISLSDDGKMFKVKIKDAGMLVKNPSLATIKKDFGIRDNVFVQKGKIPYGNEGVIPESTHGEGYDNVVIETGKTINIPVSEINISGSPRGFWGRLCQ